MKFKLKTLAIGAALSLGALASQAGEIIFNSNTSDIGTKKAMLEMVAGFEKAHPDIKVKVNIFEHEALKTSIRNFLTAEPPDVFTWFAGNRMAPYVDAGLVENISDLWKSEGMDKTLASAESAITRDGKQWGLPYTYYQWGIYYRKDIFDKLGIAEPKTWDQLVAASKKLSDNNITPFAIGTKNGNWPTGGWFDYLNLRVNGYKFHMDLTAGKIPYTDKRVAAVFDKWDVLTKPGYYLKNNSTYQWQEAIPTFVKGETAMYLMGNFAVEQMRAGGLKDDQIGFMQFPEIVKGIPMAEDAPTDTLHIASGAKNKADARKFLAYAARADVQAAMNKIQGQLPVNNKAVTPDDKFLKIGFAMLSNAKGLAQFYDRDAPADMAKAGMDGFQEYMAKPERREAILKRLESVRKRVYK